MVSRKIILIFVIACLAIISPTYYIDAADEGAQKGAELYWQATRALNQKNFTGSQAKFEEAAQYLSGKVQEDALRMAEFIGKMSPKITAKKLLKSEMNFSIIGEVKEEGRIWHLYNDNNRGEMSLLHLAISGEKPMDDLVAALGQDLFAKTMVIQNKEGYLSKLLSSIPGASSRIRMWYCDKNNTTNIVYENYYITPDKSYYSFLADDIVSQNNFAKVKCSSNYTWLWVLLAAALAIIAGAAVFYWRKKIKFILAVMLRRVKFKISKKILIIIIIGIIVLAVILVLVLVFLGGSISSFDAVSAGVKASKVARWAT